LLKELGQESITSVNDIAQESVSYKIIDQRQALLDLVSKLSQEKVICIDTETDQLSPLKANMVGIGFSTSPQQGWYIPVNGALGLEKVIAAIKPLLENPDIGFYGHNIKYDLHILQNHGIYVQNIVFDTMIA